ncbi:MAG: hypothetical protein IPG61_02580 [bacterium]|nr:hypothetical protein [bacterium]
MLTEKQQFEICAVRLLQQAGGIPAHLELAPGQDPPDVLARFGECAAAIEVRRIYADEQERGSPQRRQRGLATAVVERAMQLHCEIASAYFDVAVIFSQNTPIRDHRVAQISRMLIALVTREPIGPGDHREFSAEANWGPDWPEEVDSVSVVYLGDEGGPQWHFSGAFWVGKTTHDLVQSALDAKEARCRSLLSDSSEQWIVLVCDGSVESSALEVHDDLAREPYRSSFGRAFVLDFTGKRFVELCISGGLGVA